MTGEPPVWTAGGEVLLLGFGTSFMATAPPPGGDQPPSYTPEEVSEFMAAFNFFDQKKEGKIAIQQLGSVFRALGFDPADAKIQNLLEEINLKDHRFVEAEEFIRLLARRRPEVDQARQIKESFAMFDLDADKEGVPRRGFLAVDELRRLLTTTGDRLPDNEADELIKAADPSGLGYIAYDAFVEQQFAPPPKKKKGKKKKKK
ncbi:putative calmodulin A [Paratrimastix pyriformis]|uniref:Calmodulin A n=1 Tax=Paratrimastix pyriformis TaxID=342808 RepID=A0ABQ8UX78_9EUKA|nr:putative calmodulin A [Paratrimastix pyriformis]